MAGRLVQAWTRRGWTCLADAVRGMAPDVGELRAVLADPEIEAETAGWPATDTFIIT